MSEKLSDGRTYTYSELGDMIDELKDFLILSMRHPESPDWINLFTSVLRALFFNINGRQSH